MEKPLQGKYEFVEQYSITGCLEYDGGISGGCLKEKVFDFQPGDVVYSDKSFFNSSTDTWNIGLVILNQNKSIPYSKLEYVSEDTPATYEEEDFLVDTDLPTTNVSDISLLKEEGSIDVNVIETETSDTVSAETNTSYTDPSSANISNIVIPFAVLVVVAVIVFLFRKGK